MMTRKGRFTSAVIDEFKILGALENCLEALKYLPADGQIQEFPKAKHARSHLNDAIIDLQGCGIDAGDDPERAARPTRKPKGAK